MTLRKHDIERALSDGVARTRDQLHRKLGLGKGPEIGQLAALLDVMVISDTLEYDVENETYCLAAQGTAKSPTVPPEADPPAPAVAPPAATAPPASRQSKRTAADLRDLLWETIEGVRAGTVQESEAREIARLANSIIGVARAEMDHQKHMRDLGTEIPAPMLLGRDA